MAKAEDLHSSYIVNCVFNSFLCCTAIMLNGITIYATRKTSSLPKPLKTLLLSLAVSDVGIGLMVQPLYITRLVTQLKQNAENNSVYGAISFAFLISANFLSLASFFGVTALTVDRFLAIHLHLRYKELVTHKRVVAAVIFIWVFSASLSLTRLSDLEKKNRFAVFATFQVFCLITTALLYYKIYLAVRHHANQIRTLQVQEKAKNDVMANAAKLRKSAVGTFYVYLVFLICYLPQNCIYSATIICGASTTIKVLSRYTLTLVFLNSSLNPLIYCWKMRHIRYAFVDILRKILPNRNCEI